MKKPSLQFRIFDRHISVECDDERLRALALANFGVFEAAPERVDLAYTVVRHPEGGFRISRDGNTVAEASSDEALQYDFVYHLEKLVTIDLQYLRTDLYFVHAAALERNGRAIMIAASSGTGKSTTTWALLGSGFRYLSDELAPIDPATLDIHPYPHALCLKAPPPGPYSLPADVVRTERTLHVPVKALSASIGMQPAPLGAIVFLRRETNTPEATMAAVSPAEAGARLYTNTLNALAHPGKGLDVAVRIAGAVPSFLVDAGDLQATCELISDIEKGL